MNDKIYKKISWTYMIPKQNKLNLQMTHSSQP
jgi:hypothetical protein